MASTGGSIAFSSFLSSSSFCRKAKSSSAIPLIVYKSITSRPKIACFAVQESSAAVAAETKDKTEDKKEDKEEEKPAPAKQKPAAKAPVKPLPQMMEEDVIPPLIATLEAQQDITEIELSFQDNKLEGSFLKKGYPYSFWAFFPDGTLTGARGFSLSSYGSGVSTVEPFLVDEKRITAKHVIFWVEKRLAAQGIIPVWQE